MFLSLYVWLSDYWVCDCTLVHIAFFILFISLFILRFLAYTHYLFDCLNKFFVFYLLYYTRCYSFLCITIVVFSSRNGLYFNYSFLVVIHIQCAVSVISLMLYLSRVCFYYLIVFLLSWSLCFFFAFLVIYCYCTQLFYLYLCVPSVLIAVLSWYRVT